jgi:hypothetical protein
MTVSSCTSYCSGLGYTYAGVEYSYQVSRGLKMCNKLVASR